MLLVVSRSDVHFGFDHPFFTCPIGCLERHLSTRIRVYKEKVSNVGNSTETDENKKDHNRNNEVKSVAIIGNSMIKHLNGWDMSKKIIKSECKIYVKSFTGAKTSCMNILIRRNHR